MMTTWRKYGLATHSGSVRRARASRIPVARFIGARDGSSDAFSAREQPGRPDEQDRDDDDEADGVAITGGNVPGAQLLGDTEHEATEGGAADIAEASEDHDRKGLERRQITHRRIDDEDRTEERAGGGREPGADRERRGVDASDADAHERGGVGVLERRAHCAPQASAVD